MRFLPAIFFTSETSCPAGIFWWTPVLHTPFFLTGPRLHLLVLLSPVLAAGPSPLGVRGRFPFLLTASILPGVSSWPPSSFQSLAWIFFSSMGC